MKKVKVIKCENLFAKTRGLMLRKTIVPIYIKTKFGVHTFFVQQPILVFVLDEDNIVQYKKELKPWRVFFWNPKYYKVIETRQSKYFNSIQKGEKILISDIG